MADKLMYIPKDNAQNYLIFRLVISYSLNTQLNEPTNQNSIQSPKLLSQRIIKRY